MPKKLTLTKYTVRKTRFGYRAYILDELNYWWSCAFTQMPTLADLLASWKKGYAWKFNDAPEGGEDD